MESLYILANYFIMILAYIAPLVAVVLAICEKDGAFEQVAKKITLIYTIIALCVGPLDVSWAFTVVWLCIGTYREKGNMRLLFVALVLAVLIDIKYTDWEIDDRLYKFIDPLYGIAECWDFRNGGMHVNKIGDFLMNAMRLLNKRSCRAKTEPRVTRDPMAHYDYESE
jgi:hypothetical protein